MKPLHGPAERDAAFLAHGRRPEEGHRPAAQWPGSVDAPIRSAWLKTGSLASLLALLSPRERRPVDAHDSPVRSAQQPVLRKIVELSELMPHVARHCLGDISGVIVDELVLAGGPACRAPLPWIQRADLWPARSMSPRNGRWTARLSWKPGSCAWRPTLRTCRESATPGIG